MDFREATDRLAERVSHAELARELGVSVASIRQARLNPSALAHRTPPAGWKSVVRRLARERAQELLRLADELERER